MTEENEIIYKKAHKSFHLDAGELNSLSYDDKIRLMREMADRRDGFARGYKQSAKEFTSKALDYFDNTENLKSLPKTVFLDFVSGFLNAIKITED